MGSCLPAVLSAILEQVAGSTGAADAAAMAGDAGFYSAPTV